MSDGPRARKLADRIHEVVARTLDSRVKDPRLGFVTITEVRVTGDLQHATIFYTVLGEEAERASTAAALESAKGMLRTEVGRATRVRLTPSLTFVPDALPETAATIEDALRRAADADAAIAAQASAASYAGEADPYKRRPEDESEAAESEAAESEAAESEADESEAGEAVADHDGGEDSDEEYDSAEDLPLDGPSIGRSDPE